MEIMVENISNLWKRVTYIYIQRAQRTSSRINVRKSSNGPVSVTVENKKRRGKQPIIYLEEPWLKKKKKNDFSSETKSRGW